MSKEMWIRLVMAGTIVLVLGSTSCTKKYQVVGPDQTGQTVPAGVKAGKTASEVKGKAGERDSSYKMSDLAQEDKTRSLSREERLKSEIMEFESRPVYFDYDASELKAEARENLTQKAAWLKANLEYSILIEGHCDERGNNEYNLALGDRRAESVKKYLVNQGISDQRVETISYGEERPADRDHNEEAWSNNRRAEFRIIR